MRKHISTIFISLAVFLIVAAIIIYSTFSWGGTPKPEDFGYFGSFIGGVAGPIITALSVFFVIQQLKGDEKKNQEDRYVEMEKGFQLLLFKMCDTPIAYYNGVTVTVGNMIGLGGYPSDAAADDVEKWTESVKKLEGQLIHPIVGGLHCIIKMQSVTQDKKLTGVLSISYSERWDAYKKLVGEENINNNMIKYIDNQIELAMDRAKKGDD